MSKTKTPIEEEFMTVAEVAKRIRIGEMTVYRLIETGQLKAQRFGRILRVPKSSYEQWLASCWTQTPPR